MGYTTFYWRYGGGGETGNRYLVPYTAFGIALGAFENYIPVRWGLARGIITAPVGFGRSGG